MGEDGASSKLIFKLAIDVECRRDDLPSRSSQRSVNIQDGEEKRVVTNLVTRARTTLTP